MLYATKPKTEYVDAPPALKTAEEAAEEVENSPLSPEETAFYDQQRKAKERARREEEKQQVWIENNCMNVCETFYLWVY